MADAKKCDRCGSFYDKMADPGNKYLLSKYVSISTPIKSDLVRLVDLCPECSKMLDLWMEDQVSFVSMDTYTDWATECMNRPGEDENE